MKTNKNDQAAHDALNGFPPEIYMKFVPEENYLALKEAAAAGLKELERINTFIVIDNNVIANLKNVLV
jgi:hypothetical protein